MREPSRATATVPTSRDVHEAWQFLTDIRGEWGKSRDFWASMNGLNPDVVREAALQRGLSRAARVALMEGEAPKKHRQSNRIGKKTSDRVEARNAALAADYAAGMKIADMRKKYDLSSETIMEIARALGAKRSTEFYAQNGREAAAKKAANFAPIRAEINRLRESGMTIEEIAAATGRSWGSVKSILARERRKAASAIEEARGGGSRAGGGGVDVSASFHAQSMEEATR